MRDANGSLSEIRAKMDEIERDCGKPDGRYPNCAYGCGWCTGCGECFTHGLCPCVTDVPRTRNSDPSTSHEAEAFMRSSGKLNAHQDYVLSDVKDFPGYTARELDHRQGPAQGSGMFHRRLVELERKGLVRRGEARKCRIGSTRAATWYPVEQKP